MIEVALHSNLSPKAITGGNDNRVGNIQANNIDTHLCDINPPDAAHTRLTVERHRCERWINQHLLCFQQYICKDRILLLVTWSKVKAHL